jgi:restriction endonuclease S subunit
MKNGSPVKSTDEESSNAERVLAVGAEEVTAAGVLFPEKCETVEVNGKSAGRESLGEDEVVFVARGNLAGKAAVPLDDSTQVMVPNTSLIRLEVNTERVEPTYLVHSIMSDRVQSLINRHKSQLSTPRIRQRDLKEIKVPMVSKSTQRKFKRQLSGLRSLLQRQHQSSRLIEELSDSILDRFR